MPSPLTKALYAVMSLVFMAIVMAQTASAQGVDWSGIWATDFGPVVLRQNGALVWGDHPAADVAPGA